MVALVSKLVILKKRLSSYVGKTENANHPTEVSSVLEQRSCVDHDICSPFAECVYDDLVRSFRCECLPGYAGDGQTCQPESTGK